MMADLTTSYMGLKLRNPIIVSSSDLTGTASRIMQCDEAGAGAVVLKSIFEEQFKMREDIPEGDYGGHPEALDYLRGGGLLEYAPQKMCKMIEDVKKKVNIPVFASINCQSSKLWPSFAHQLQEAGVDGLELNIYSLPLSLDLPGIEFEKYHLEILDEVKKVVSIPVSVKLTSHLTSVPFLANKLAKAGCDALILFNWFLRSDINIEKLKTRNLIGKGDFFQSLKWVALLAGRVDCDIASSGGVHKAEDIIKQILAGASAVQICTLFYRQGLDVIQGLLREVEAWMEKKQYSGIDDFRSELSFKRQELTFKDSGEADAYFRAQYLKTYSKVK
jgi:dihydroorotate dehydrogenase (fumarate)